MQPACVWLSVVLMVGTAHAATAQTREIIGYYPSWKLNRSANPLTPAKIPYHKLTIINYAFFYPLADGSIVGRDSLGDDLILNGERDPENGKQRSGTALVELAHRNGVRVMLSIGGWDDSNNFPEVTANERTRVVFAHSCSEQVRRYGFDGIDIDWEFPCLVEHRGTPADRANFTTLLRLVRDSLNALGGETGRHLLLTAALPADEARARNFEMDSVSQLLDMLNVMTYDFSGEWDSLSGHNSPLYAPRPTDSLRNVDAAFNLYAGRYRVPPSKINLGVPFYGHTFSDCVALYAPHKGADTVHFSTHGCFYYDVVACREKFTRTWDSLAGVPYLVNTLWKALISYDDEESVGLKAQYAIDHHARGLIIWEITGDYMPDRSTPLLDALYSKFAAAAK